LGIEQPFLRRQLFQVAGFDADYDIMNFTRKIDRAMQWAGEKMGAEAKATHSEEFKELEAEMDIRHEGLCFPAN
jgi:hypothetical protein